MVTDTHTRCWASPEQLGPEIHAALRRRGREPDGHEEAHAAALERVDRGFVLGFRSGLLGASIGPEWIAQLVRRRPDRLIGVAGLDPMLPSWRDDLERAVDLGLKAITVSPSMQGFHPAHSDAMALWDACARRGLPVLVARLGPAPARAILEYDRPLLWDEVFRTFPDLVASFGSLGAPFPLETLALVEKHERVFADVAGLGRNPIEGYRALAAASAAGTLGKLLFASGFPAETPAEAIARLFELNAFLVGLSLPTVPQAEIRGLVDRDACRTLGIAPPLSTSFGPRLPGGSGSARPLERTDA